ncbi:response regulator [Cohnella sp. GbtcB17]|uniref:response regulator n=1 Tax=Cohnella sp. GbtcB17 TaxID=2824762 RepID=UPI0034D6C107
MRPKMTATNGLHTKLLIVDDEPVICEGLRLTIDWESLGVEVVGVAYDGEEALQLTREHGADIVLTDIRMEEMDGLQLTERLKREFPRVRVVMISGYEHFEYARQAMRLGVTDYLLKPVDVDELVQVVKGIVAELEEAEPSANGDEEAMWLSAVLRSSPSSEPPAPPQSMNGESFRIIVSQLADFAELYSGMPEDEYRDVQRKWLALIQEKLMARDIRSVAVFDHRNVLFTLAMSDRLQAGEPMRRLLEETMEAWTGAGRLYCAASAPFPKLEQTASASAETRELLQWHDLTDRAALLPEDRFLLSKDRPKSDYDCKAILDRLVSFLFKQDAAGVAALVHEMFASLADERRLLPEAVQIYDELLALLRQRLRQSGLTDLEHGRHSPIDLHANNSYAAIEAIAVEEMRQLIRLIDLNGLDKSHWIIEKAKQYMTENYDQDLKASEVAGWLKITPGYFSLLFKQSTGKSFKEYLNEYRIDHAKHLLATTHDKVFEIAERVGYKEYKYFVSVFKSYTGITPKEYRAFKATR